MRRHIIDHPHKRTGARLAQYIKLARRAGVHPSVMAMHRRTRGAAGARRLAAYLRIARGQSA